MSKRFTEVRPPPNPEDLPEDLRKQMEEPVPTKMTDLEMAALNGELELIPDTFEVNQNTTEKIESGQAVEPFPGAVDRIQRKEEIKRDKVDVEATIQEKALAAIKQMEDDLTTKQMQQLADYAKVDNYNITFEDGTTKRFYRVGLNNDLTEQIKDLQIELETILYLEGDHQGEQITRRELRLKRKQLLKLGLNYLKDSQTHKTMTEEQAKKVIPGSMLTSIIDSCIYRTSHDIVDPKV